MPRPLAPPPATCAGAAAGAGAAAAGAAAAVAAGAAGFGGSLKLAPDWFAMYTTAAVTSQSESVGLPPRGGITPFGLWMPLIAFFASVARPSLMCAAHAALSPIFGAPAIPCA